MFKGLYSAQQWRIRRAGPLQQVSPSWMRPKVRCCPSPLWLLRPIPSIGTIVPAIWGRLAKASHVPGAAAVDSSGSPSQPLPSPPRADVEAGQLEAAESEGAPVELPVPLPPDTDLSVPLPPEAEAPVPVLEAGLPVPVPPETDLSVHLPPVPEEAPFPPQVIIAPPEDLGGPQEQPQL